MISEKDIQFLAEMDGISVEEEKEKYRKWQEETRATLLRSYNCLLSDEELDEIFMNVLYGFQRRNA